MKDEATTRRFRLLPRGEGRWEIRTTDASIVARLELTDNDTVAVDWVQPRPLPREYSTPRAALADLVMWEDRPRGGTKPIPIPHSPPPRLSL